MVSVMDPPAASAARTRSVTSDSAGAVKRAVNRPGPRLEVGAARQVLPWSRDIQARTPVIGVA